MRVVAAAALALLTGSGCSLADGLPGSRQPQPRAAPVAPYVVVATLDTGGNLFHPTWRRDRFAHPSEYIPGYPADAGALPLVLGEDFLVDVESSLGSLDLLLEKRWPMWVPGTNLIGLWSHDTDQKPVFDTVAILDGATPSHSHGAHASSQIGGASPGHALAPDAFLVIMDRTNDGSSGVGVYQSNADGLRWAADQSWIDIIHTNIQNPGPLAGATPVDAPGFEGYPEAVAYAVAKGKLVVSAGGNFYAEFTETSPHAGPPGVLVAGANDNCVTHGYTDFSNPDPHVVMDGLGTLSADDNSYDDDRFSGTSSASPRITGYAAQLLLETRRAVADVRGFRDGHLIVLEDGTPRPTQGPLADGRLHAAELHEVIRKTADPNPHESIYDGNSGLPCVPQPVDLPFAFYPKMGYGEVSEHTLPQALAVLLGQAPMPARPVEDAYFGFSEAVRDAIWSD
jgi:hypothetical protein